MLFKLNTTDIFQSQKNSLLLFQHFEQISRVFRMKSHWHFVLLIFVLLNFYFLPVLKQVIIDCN